METKTTQAAGGAIGFLAMKHNKKELAAALKVLRTFKGCESQEEWLACPFIAWSKLEQLEEFLEHMVENKPLKDDTKQAIVASSV